MYIIPQNMKGTEVTEVEIEHAREFLRVTNNYRAGSDRVSVSQDQLAKLLAWYGALRGGDRSPGQWVVKERPDTVPAQISGRVVEEKEPASVTQSAPCPTCFGNPHNWNYQFGKGVATCPTCHTGHPRERQAIIQNAPCPECGGRPFRVKKYTDDVRVCPTCKGTGVETKA